MQKDQTNSYEFVQSIGLRKCFSSCPAMAWSPGGRIDRKYTDLSQEIFVIDMLRAFKWSSKHRRKHVLQPLQLYGDLRFYLHGHRLRYVNIIKGPGPIRKVQTYILFEII